MRGLAKLRCYFSAQIEKFCLRKNIIRNLYDFQVVFRLPPPDLVQLNPAGTVSELGYEIFLLNSWSTRH